MSNKPLGRFESVTIDNCYPIFIRLDGNNFKQFTKDLKQPIDSDLVEAFIKTTQDLVKKFNACCAYTGSDEITLMLWKPSGWNNYGLRVEKIVSLTASYCTERFNYYFPKVPGATFDSRVFNVANPHNHLAYRVNSVYNNTLHNIAHHLHGHRALHNKNIIQLQAMTLDWRTNNNCNVHGTFFYEIDEGHTGTSKTGEPISYTRSKIVTTQNTQEFFNWLDSFYKYNSYEKEASDYFAMLDSVQDKL